MISRELLEQIGRHLIRPLKMRMSNMIARAVVSGINDAKKLQLLQIGVEHGVDLDDAERFQDYGFTSVPEVGAEAVAVFPNGDRGHAIIVKVDDRRYRLKGLLSGEVAIYHKDGAMVKLNAAGDIIIRCKAGRDVFVDDGSGAVALALKSDVDELRTKLHGHTHSYTDDGSPATTGVGPSVNAMVGTTVLKGK